MGQTFPGRPVPPTYGEIAISEILAVLIRIESRVAAVQHKILEQQEKIMAAIDDIATAVAQEDTVIAGAITLLGNLSQQIQMAGVDPVKLAAVISDIQSNKQRLADAIVANTPAAPPPADPPPAAGSGDQPVVQPSGS